MRPRLSCYAVISLFFPRGKRMVRKNILSATLMSIVPPCCAAIYWMLFVPKPWRELSPLLVAGRP